MFTDIQSSAGVHNTYKTFFYCYSNSVIKSILANQISPILTDTGIHNLKLHKYTLLHFFINIVISKAVRLKLLWWAERYVNPLKSMLCAFHEGDTWIPLIIIMWDKVCKKNRDQASFTICRAWSMFFLHIVKLDLVLCIKQHNHRSNKLLPVLTWVQQSV